MPGLWKSWRSTVWDAFKSFAPNDLGVFPVAELLARQQLEFPKKTLLGQKNIRRS
jgi:hypothetical protein